MIDKILEKIDEYNIFNYVLPGIIFTYLLKFYVGIDIFQNNILEMIFIYYFIGSVISRIGSIFVGEILKKIGFIKYTEYEDYIKASQKDEFVKKLLINNNMYRTTCSMFIITLILKFGVLISNKINLNSYYTSTFLIVLGIIIYLFSFRKQTKQIYKRIEETSNKDGQ